MFAHQKVTLPKGKHKIIILDEADRYRTPASCILPAGAALEELLSVIAPLLPILLPSLQYDRGIPAGFEENNGNLFQDN